MVTGVDTLQFTNLFARFSHLQNQDRSPVHDRRKRSVYRSVTPPIFIGDEIQVNYWPIQTSIRVNYKTNDWTTNSAERRSHQAFQKAKDLCVVGIRESHWMDVPEQFPVSDILQTGTMWSFGLKPRILKGGDRKVVSRHHRSDKDNFECNRSTWFWWTTENTVANRAHNTAH